MWNSGGMLWGQGTVQYGGQLVALPGLLVFLL